MKKVLLKLINAFSWPNAILNQKVIRFRIISHFGLTKEGCIFTMGVVSKLPHAEFGPNDHQKDAPQFSEFHRCLRVVGQRIFHNLWQRLNLENQKLDEYESINKGKAILTCLAGLVWCGQGFTDLEPDLVSLISWVEASMKPCPSMVKYLTPLIA